MPKDMEARQLIKMVPALAAAIDLDADTAALTGEGWEAITHSGFNIALVWRGYIDLAGYTQDDLTFFSQAVDVQDNGISLASSGITLTTIVDMVTTRRIRNIEINPINSNGFIDVAPGIPLEGLDIQEVVYGNNRAFTQYSATNSSLLQLFGSTFGSGNPTASDRLHITRVIVPSGTGTGESLNVQSCNFLVGGVTAHEKDLVYIERLRRAYTQDPGRNV
jgi:hypothetical protein